MEARRYLALFLEENRTQPELVKNESGHIQVKVGFDTSWESLEAVMSGLVTDDELEIARRIWSDDNCDRDYEVTELGLKITISG